MRYEVPVAFIFVKLPVPVFSTLIFPVEALRVVSESEFAMRLANAAVLPVMFVTVVLPRVDEPVVKKFAATSVPVFVDEPTLSVSRFPL